MGFPPDLLATFLVSCFEQRVILEGVRSDWRNIITASYLMTYQPLLLPIVFFYLALIVFSWKKSILLVIALLNLILT